VSGNEQELRALRAVSLPRPSNPLETVGQFSIGIAHDFNNILAIILSNARMLADTYVSGDAMPDELRDVISAAHLGADMVRRLLRFARHEPAEGKPVSLHAVADELPRKLRTLLTNDIRVKVECDGGPLMVVADSGVIEEIVMNLVTNARDAMPDGGTLRVSVREAHRDGGLDACANVIVPGDYATITIRDTGTGLDDLTRHRMFEPFFTTKPSQGGTGLGLAMCYALVRQLHGFVEVASTLGVGTSVIVSLPLEHAAEQRGS
jgi:two-component system, cell cycle sensor histidine kinase and response regulator CckA